MRVVVARRRLAASLVITASLVAATACARVERRYDTYADGEIINVHYTRDDKLRLTVWDAPSQTFTHVDVGLNDPRVAPCTVGKIYPDCVIERKSS